MLKIAICLKQIPLIEDASFDFETKTIRRDGPNVISAFDLRAVALAMELKQRFGADTTAVTMGPPQARHALVEALAMGIDRAVHLQDRALAASDTLATSRALAQWLKRERWDLILLGKYSLDSETGQVGPEIAELLGIAQVTGARKLEIDGAALRAERESDEGFDEIECRMPALLTCAERIAQPIKVKPGALELANSKPIETLGVANLGLDPSEFGLAGSPTWVKEIRVEQRARRPGRLIDAANPHRAVEELLATLDRLGVLRPRPRVRKPTSSTWRAPRRAKDLWVACETTLKGEVTRASLELLSRGDELATELGGALVAVGCKSEIAASAELLCRFGADLVLTLDHPELGRYAAETRAEAMAQLVQDRAPWGLLLPASERGRDWGPRLAARLGLGLTGDAIGLELDEQRRLVALKPAFGGNVIAPILSKTYPQMATVRAGVLELAAPASARVIRVETFTPTLLPALSKLRGSHPLLDASVAPLDGAEVVVGIGTGVGGPQGVAEVAKLARALNAALCATRRVTDAGWLPRQIQVGLTGKAIEPRLYFAVGIRGAPNHVVGIKRAETIVAINNDPDAPIFELATLGLVADWTTIVSPLAEAIRKRLAPAA